MCLFNSKSLNIPYYTDVLYYTSETCPIQNTKSAKSEKKWTYFWANLAVKFPAFYLFKDYVYNTIPI